MNAEEFTSVPEWRDSRPPWVKPPAPFITISRECCAGGSALAQLLVERLSATAAPGGAWSVVGGNVVGQMLRNHHLPEELSRFLPEDRVPELTATVGEVLGRHPSLWDLVQKTNRTLRELAREGHVVLVGRGANFVTAGLRGGVHVRLVAPADHRARFYAARFGVRYEAALAHNAACDNARRRYVRAHCEGDVADPAAYDLVINTAHVPLDEAAAMVAEHVRAHAREAA